MRADRNALVARFDRALPSFGRMELQPARFDAVARRLSVSAHIGAEFADGRGVVRGGFFAALLDDVMTGAATLTLGAEVEPRLISQSLDYFNGAGPGEFTAEGWVVSVASTIASPGRSSVRRTATSPRSRRAWSRMRTSGEVVTPCLPPPSFASNDDAADC